MLLELQRYPGQNQPLLSKKKGTDAGEMAQWLGNSQLSVTSGEYRAFFWLLGLMGAHGAHTARQIFQGLESC